jgi:pimeloyl-ACP methyl ester carboxylesterase
VIDFVQADTEAALGALLDSTTEAEVHLLPQIVSRLKGPVYFLAGEQDMIMELKYVRHLASFHWLFHLQGGNIVEIPDCGHLSMLEQTENVTAAIAEILQKETARPCVTV